MSEVILKVGDNAPDFTMKNQHDKEISLSGLRGKKVILSFHPLAWTGVCEIQMRTLELKKKVFEELNTVALGISVDSLYCKKEWAKYMNITETNLLADFWPHGETAKKYGQFIEKAGVSGRANIVVDEEGKIIFMKRYEITEVPNIEEVISVLRK